MKINENLFEKSWKKIVKIYLKKVEKKPMKIYWKKLKKINENLFEKSWKNWWKFIWKKLKKKPGWGSFCYLPQEFSQKSVKSHKMLKKNMKIEKSKKSLFF